MKCLLLVCLAVATGIAIYGLDDDAQTPALRKGVSVQMAVTQNAVAMPAADEEDAWVVVVTAEGKLYFGVKPVSTERLAEQMRVRPRRREQNLYIKADARAPFASVERAITGTVSVMDLPSMTVTAVVARELSLAHRLRASKERSRLVAKVSLIRRCC